MYKQADGFFFLLRKKNSVIPGALENSATWDLGWSQKFAVVFKSE